MPRQLRGWKAREPKKKCYDYDILSGIAHEDSHVAQLIALPSFPFRPNKSFDSGVSLHLELDPCIPTGWTGETMKRAEQVVNGGLCAVDLLGREML